MTVAMRVAMATWPADGGGDGGLDVARVEEGQEETEGWRVGPQPRLELHHGLGGRGRPHHHRRCGSSPR